eukprot:symbB.v1.2.018448.t1/scaffold1473.1/size116783/7
MLAQLLQRDRCRNKASRPRRSFTPEPQRAAPLPPRRTLPPPPPSLAEPASAPLLGTPRSFPLAAERDYAQLGTPRSLECKALTPTSWHSWETPTPSEGMPSPTPPRLQGSRPAQIQEPLSGRPERPPEVAVEYRRSSLSPVIVACPLCAKQLCHHRGICYPTYAVPSSYDRQKDLSPRRPFDV